MGKRIINALNKEYSLEKYFYCGDNFMRKGNLSTTPFTIQLRSIPKKEKTIITSFIKDFGATIDNNVITCLNRKHYYWIFKLIRLYYVHRNIINTYRQIRKKTDIKPYICLYFAYSYNIHNGKLKNYFNFSRNHFDDIHYIKVNCIKKIKNTIFSTTIKKNTICRTYTLSKSLDNAKEFSFLVSNRKWDKAYQLIKDD